MKKIIFAVALALAATTSLAQQVAPVPVVVKEADKPKPSKRDLGLHVMVSCVFYVVGDGVSNQITINVTNWPTACPGHPAPFTAPDTSDSLVQGVFFNTPNGPIGGPYTIPIIYDNVGNFTFTLPAIPPTGMSVALAFNVYYSH